MISRDQIDYIIKVLEKEHESLKEERSYVVHSDMSASKLNEITDVMGYNKACISTLQRMRKV